MNEIAHAVGVRLLKLRQKLAARDGMPGYQKNCAALRQEIARLEQSTIPTVEEADKLFEQAREIIEGSDNG